MKLMDNYKEVEIVASDKKILYPAKTYMEYYNLVIQPIGNEVIIIYGTTRTKNWIENIPILKTNKPAAIMNGHDIQNLDLKKLIGVSASNNTTIKLNPIMNQNRYDVIMYKDIPSKDTIIDLLYKVADNNKILNTTVIFVLYDCNKPVYFKKYNFMQTISKKDYNLFCTESSHGIFNINTYNGLITFQLTDLRDMLTNVFETNFPDKRTNNFTVDVAAIGLNDVIDKSDHNIRSY
jgi:hypothetical protein